MELLADALNNYKHAERLIEWLKNTGHLGIDADVGALAFDYAVGIAPAPVISAFMRSAREIVDYRREVAATPIRHRGRGNAISDAQRVQTTIKEEHEAHEARALASQLYTLKVQKVGGF